MEKRIPIKSKHRRATTTIVQPSDLPNIERYKSEKNPSKPKVYTLVPNMGKMKSVPAHTIENRIAETRTSQSKRRTK